MAAIRKVGYGLDQHVATQPPSLAARQTADSLTLPEGVFVRHHQGTREKIFWIQNLNLNLAKEFSHDRPFFFVTLTARDMDVLGRTPTVQRIAARLAAKILAIQGDGPYTIGGVCIGGLIAYEVALQMRAAGREVSLVALLDAPCQPYLKSYKSLSSKLRHPIFFLQKVLQLQPRRYFSHLGRRLRLTRCTSAETEQDQAQEVIEKAAVSYYPERYDGKVLLLLPEQSPPHLNFLLGWQSVVPRNLTTLYVDGPHRSFITLKNVRTIAETIQGHLPHV